MGRAPRVDGGPETRASGGSERASSGGGVHPRRRPRSASGTRSPRRLRACRRLRFRRGEGPERGSRASATWARSAGGAARPAAARARARRAARGASTRVDAVPSRKASAARGYRRRRFGAILRARDDARRAPGRQRRGGTTRAGTTRVGVAQNPERAAWHGCPRGTRARGARANAAECRLPRASRKTPYNLSVTCQPDLRLEAVVLCIFSRPPSHSTSSEISRPKARADNPSPSRRFPFSAEHLVFPEGASTPDERLATARAAHTSARTRTRGLRCARKQRSCIGRSTGVNHTANTRTRRCVHARLPGAPPLAVGASPLRSRPPGRAVARRDRGNAPCPARGETRDRPRQRSTAQSEGDIGAFRATRARRRLPRLRNAPRAKRARRRAAHGRRRARETRADFFARGDAARPAAGWERRRARARVLGARAERARSIPAPPRGRSPFPAPRDRLTVAFPVSRVDLAISPTDRAWFFFSGGKRTGAGINQ